MTRDRSRWHDYHILEHKHHKNGRSQRAHSRSTSSSSSDRSHSFRPTRHARKHSRDSSRSSSLETRQDYSLSPRRSRRRTPSRGQRRGAFSSSSSSSTSPSPALSRDHRTKEEHNQNFVVLGRRLNLARDSAVLQKTLQFVKKISHDPSIDGDLRGKPDYVIGSESNGKPSVVPADPRFPRNEYTQACATLYDGRLKRASLEFDENYVGKLPPLLILLQGLQENIKSKALLVGLIESMTDASLAGSIKDVQLGSGRALLVLKDALSSARLCKALNKSTATELGWQASFDPDGGLFAKIAQKTQDARPAAVAPHPPETKPATHPLKCSRHVPCLLISYTLCPSTESRRVLEEVFRSCRVYNVERGVGEWHVHLSKKSDVEYALRWRESFHSSGKVLSFSCALFSDPPLALNFKEKPDFLPRQKTRSSEVLHEASERVHSRSSHASHALVVERRGSLSFKAIQATPQIRKDIDELYRPKHHTFSPTNDTPPSPAEAYPSPSQDDFKDLPIFNRRLIERRRAEEEAAQAAVLVAEKKLQSQALRDTAKTRKSAQKSGWGEKKEDFGQSRLALAVPPLYDSKDSQQQLHLSLGLHESGAARTEGFYRQRAAEKKVYLQDFGEGHGSGGATFDSLNSTLNTYSNPSSRLHRVQNRRLQSSMEHLGSDLFSKHTAFMARKKKLLLGRSSIHSWGLFAGEDIEPGEMVIEYVGEIIRHTVANVRERQYELELRAKGSSEIASSYFFRLDGNLVVDATHKGNLSRFINHSCDPSCAARTLTVDGARRIVMYARCHIRRGEEITYDYKFPIEDDPAKKIRCLCGVRNCRGTLN